MKILNNSQYETGFMIQEKFTFFYHGIFSQWYTKAPFIIDGIYYKTAEHYMMWFKSEVFGGYISQKILDAKHPSEAKALGRQVPYFDKNIWNKVTKIGVFRGNIAKFSQHSDLLELLFETAETTLVEASPVDFVWGIGLDADNPLALDRSTWKGTNWLGEVLTDVRETLFGNLSLDTVTDIP